MPRLKLTKSAIDALPTPAADTVYWDAASPGFGVKVTPKGRKVFVVLYRTGGAGSRLRKSPAHRHRAKDARQSHREFEGGAALVLRRTRPAPVRNCCLAGVAKPAVQNQGLVTACQAGRLHSILFLEGRSS
ncbi:MAG: Arm DNA-binding domain-containing protein [Xanthobacteraceae bacterium]